ncbi:MAG: hypothetical protein AAFN93_21080 [Bacteroidota bacterium]
MKTKKQLAAKRLLEKLRNMKPTQDDAVSDKESYHQHLAEKHK